MHKKKGHEDYIDLDDILEELKRCRIPALTLDIRWQAIFNTEDKSAKIAKLEKKVNDALKSRGRITTDKKDLIKVKKRLMNEIVQNMNSPENSRADKKIRKSKELIEEIAEGKRPSDCLGCRACEAVCPQQIKIADVLADFVTKL